MTEPTTADLYRRLADRQEALEQARRLIGYAFHLRQNGEGAPGGNETWGAFDRRAEEFLRFGFYPAPDGYSPVQVPENTGKHPGESAETGAKPGSLKIIHSGDWNPRGSNGHPATLSEAVGQALGTASMCWEDVLAAGVFDDAQCARVYDGLMAYLSDWADQHRAQANEATAAKMQTAIAQSRPTPHLDHVQDALKGWADLAYEMWALILQSEAVEGQHQWEQDQAHLRARLHALLHDSAGSWSDPIPGEPGPKRNAWLLARGWDSYDEWLGRDGESERNDGN